MQVGDHRMLWISAAEARLVKRLVKAHDQTGGGRHASLLEHLQLVLDAFSDEGERLRELEVTCRANSFWTNEVTANGVVRKIRAARRKQEIAHPPAEEVSRLLEKSKRVKRLRGGIGG